jgi:hypothetical protein
VDEEIRIVFTESPDGEIAGIHWREEHLFQVAKVDHDGPKWKNTKYNYKYRVQFYGDLFNAGRKRLIDPFCFFRVFEGEIAGNRVQSSVSRIDICADIVHFIPKEILDGIKGGRLKEVSEFGKNLKTGEMESFYYGKKSGNNEWFIRVYDKLEDSRVKGKEKDYRDYFQVGQVTRLEAEVHSETLKDKQINLMNVQDLKVLWSLFSSFIENKYNSWKVYKFLKREMEKNGFCRIALEKREHDPNPFSKEQHAMLLKTYARNYNKRYDDNPLVFLAKELPEFEDGVLRFITHRLLTVGGSNQKVFPSDVR